MKTVKTQKTMNILVQTDHGIIYPFTLCLKIFSLIFIKKLFFEKFSWKKLLIVKLLFLVFIY